MAASSTTPTTTPYGTLSLLALIAGGLLAVGGACAGLAVLALPLFASRNPITDTTLLGSFTAIGLVYGTLLLLTGVGLRQGRLTERFHLPHPAVFVLLFVAAIVLGQMVLAADLLPAYLFPPLYILVSAAIPLTLLAYQARRAPATSYRSVLAQFTWGGLATTVLALVFEILVGVVLFVASLIALWLLLGTAGINALAQQLTSSLDDPGRLMSILAQDPRVLIVVGLAAGTGVALLVPLVEELLKSLGPAMLMARAKPSRGAALLWGLAAGAGFAFTENMLNSQGSLDLNGLGLPGAQKGVWAATMLLRGGTSLIHIVAACTVAAGWHSALVRGKLSRLILFGLVAGGAHGTWNLLSLALGGALGTAFTQDFSVSPFGLVLVGGVLVALAILLLCCIVWLRFLNTWATR